MSYKICEVDLSETLPEITLDQGLSGIALIVRRYDRLLGFILEPTPFKVLLSPSDLKSIIETSIDLNALRESSDRSWLYDVELTNFPSLAVAICTKDRPQDLDRCLTALSKLQGKPFEFEVLVVDNASSDSQTMQVALSFPGIRYVREDMPGLNFARNRALIESNSDLIGFIDDDAVTDHRWLYSLLEAWSENQDAAAFTGQVLPYELTTKAQIDLEISGGFRFGFNKIRFDKSFLDKDELYPVNPGIFGAGCNMVLRKEVLQRLGGFDEALDTTSLGGGDHDIFYRIARQNYPIVYQPDCLVFHRHRKTHSALRKMYYQTWGKGFMALLYKSYRNDPTQRPRIRKLICQWFSYQFSRILARLQGNYVLSLDLLAAELFGGIVGLIGTYELSSRRARLIRQKSCEHLF